MGKPRAPYKINRVNFTLDDGLYQQFKEVVPKQKRSKAINEAMKLYIDLQKNLGKQP